jgi:hypothetical protein
MTIGARGALFLALMYPFALPMQLGVFFRVAGCLPVTQLMYQDVLAVDLLFRFQNPSTSLACVFRICSGVTSQNRGKILTAALGSLILGHRPPHACVGMFGSQQIQHHRQRDTVWIETFQQSKKRIGLS